MRETVSKAAHVLREEGVENFGLRFARRFGVTSLRNYVLYDRWGFDADASDFEVRMLDVAPSDIVLTQQFPFDVRGEDGIVGEGRGTWHRCVRRFDQYRLFRGLRGRFVEGKSWEETVMYRTAIERLERDGVAWNGCTTREEIRRRCEFVDQLYDDMSENGYLSQDELRAARDHESGMTSQRGANNQREATNQREVSNQQEMTDRRKVANQREVNGVRFPDELRVAIGPDGQLIRVASGRHRLAIAKLLEIEEIPAVVQIVHEDCPDRPPGSRYERGFSAEGV